MADDQSLVLSSNAKPRQKWTRQLHECFVEAVSRLGGADKATPRAVMHIMGVPGLTLYHLKSHLQALLVSLLNPPMHENSYRVCLFSANLAGYVLRLQKYRLAVRRDTEATCNFNGDGEQFTSRVFTLPLFYYMGNGWFNIFLAANCRTKERHYVDTDMNRSMLQLHMELQRKLHEQLEVQKHLQLRIEAQGKYLQSVLRKAQETLAGYSLDSLEMEAASADLSELMSVVDAERLGFSVSGGRPVHPPHADCSSDSCLTSLEGPDWKGGDLCKLESGSCYCNSSGGSDEIGANSGKPTKNLAKGGEGWCSSICGDDCNEGQLGSGKRHSQVWQNCTGVSEEIDLNR